MTKDYEKYVAMSREEVMKLKGNERDSWRQAMREKRMKDNLRFATGVVMEERNRLMEELHLSADEVNQIMHLAVGLLQDESIQCIDVNVGT